MREPSSLKFGSDVNVSPGEAAGVGVWPCIGEVRPPATTQGEPGMADDSNVWEVGTAGPSLALTGGDFVNFADPLLPCEERGSSPEIFFSWSFVFSRSSLTPSADFFLTRPAAPSAVVARCIILILPDRTFPSLFCFRGSLSFPSVPLVLPLGVDGFDRPEDSAVVGDGDKKGDFARGGVQGLGMALAVGVGGTTANSGASRPDSSV